MSVKEIALIQHRAGIANELPDQLELAELGFATDTGDLLIGAPGNPLVTGRKRAENNQYPYENIQILTEVSKNLELINHSYHGNSLVEPVFPTIITGTFTAADVDLGDTIDLNSTIIDLTTGPSPGVTLDDVISAINAAGVPGVFAFNSLGKIRIISTSGSDISLINVVGQPLQRLFIAPAGESGINYPASDIVIRTLQSHLDDKVSIKSFGIVGDGVQDDAELINAALIALYTVSTANIDKKTVFFPAGEYILNGNSVFLPPNAKLVGEGKDRTIFKKTDSTSSKVLGTMDGDGRYSILLAFGTDSAAQPSNITIEDIMFENLDDADVVDLVGATNVTFRRCKFKSTGTAGILFQTGPGGGFLNQSNFVFEDCEFEGGSKAIYLNSLVSNVQIINCEFTDLFDETIDFSGTLSNAPVNAVIRNSNFVETSSSNVISLSLASEKVSMIDNRFDLDPGVTEVWNASHSSWSNHRQETPVIGDTNTLMFESFPLGPQNTVLVIDYVIQSINNPRSGVVTIFYDASTIATDPLTLNDSNSDVSAVFTAFMSNPVGEAEVSLENQTGDELVLRYSYRYAS